MAVWTATIYSPPADGMPYLVVVRDEDWNLKETMTFHKEKDALDFVSDFQKTMAEGAKEYE